MGATTTGSYFEPGRGDALPNVGVRGAVPTRAERRNEARRRKLAWGSLPRAVAAKDPRRSIVLLPQGQ